MENDQITLLGIKFVVNPYVPDDCIIVSEKVYNILKDYNRYGSDTSLLSTRSNK